MDNDQSAISFSSRLANAAPVMTKRLFSQLTGLGEEQIRGMIEKGHLPSVKIGKHRMVNVALLTKESLEREFEQ